LILEGIRLLTDWYSGLLKDAAGQDQSINTWLAKVPLDAQDKRPDRIVAVLDPTRNAKVARGEPDPAVKFPIILVGQSSPGDFEGQVRTLPPQAVRDANATFLVAYVTQKHDSEVADAMSWYTLRAIVASTQTFLLDSNQLQRVRNTMEIRNCQRIRFGPTLQGIGAGVIRGVVELDLQLRDAWA